MAGKMHGTSDTRIVAACFCSRIVHTCKMQSDPSSDVIEPALMPGQRLARGVCRHLASLGFSAIEEFTPERGKRLDVMALGPSGELWIIECKSSRADFSSDSKWDGYLEWGDRYFWAVDTDFPTDILPDETGPIVADDYGAEILRMGPETKLAGARRTAVVRRFAHHAARRLQALRDPAAGMGAG